MKNKNNSYSILICFSLFICKMKNALSRALSASVVYCYQCYLLKFHIADKFTSYAKRLCIQYTGGFYLTKQASDCTFHPGTVHSALLSSKMSKTRQPEFCCYYLLACKLFSTSLDLFQINAL